MVPENVSNPTTKPAHVSLEEVLDVAASNQTDPLCLSFGPLRSPGSKPVFAALVAVQDASGRLLASWTSEPVFGSSEAAVEHAEDVIGCEIWPLLCGCCI